MQRKWRRRTIGVLVVAIAATLAIAAPAPDVGGQFISASPNIIGIRHSVGSNLPTGTVVLHNGSNTPFTVGSITYSCDSAMQLANGSGGSQFVLGAGSDQNVVVECPGSLPAGMQRCTFTVHDAGNFPVLSFLGFCETFGAAQLGAVPTMVQFPPTPLGQESAPMPVTIGNMNMTTTVPQLQLQVDNDNFLVGSPCQNSLGCDDGSIPPMTGVTVQVICKPNSPGVHTGKLFAIGNNGFAVVGGPIQLDCPTAAGNTTPTLTVTPPNVLLGAVEVDGGTDQATIQLKNAGTSGALTINSLSISDNGVIGAGADWSFTVDGQCATAPGCILGPQQVLNVRLTFDPSGFNSRPAKLIINYTDPIGTQQDSADLDGGGVGATLELVNATALDFGVVPLDTPSMMLSFTLRNQGNRQTLATLVANPAAPFQFPASVMVDPGQTDVFVNCFSSSEVAATRTLTINGNDAPMPAETLSLICDVRDTAIIATPSAIPLGERRIGATVPSQLVTISRSGASEVPLTSALLETDPDPNLALAGNLPHLTQSMTPAMTTLTVTPATEATLDNRIRITPMAGSSIDVPISGSIVRPDFTITDVMTLGTFCVGQPTSPTSVTYTSTGTATIAIQDVALAGGATSPFNLMKTTPSTYPVSLAPNGGKAIVLVTPKRVEDDGSVTSELDVADDVQWTTDFGSPVTHVTAKYVADGGAIAPGSLDFGDVPIRIAVDNDQQVTLQNCSTGQLELVMPSIPAPFELTDQFPTLLDPADRATFSIAFRPTQTGPVEEELVVMSTDGAQFTVTLRGNGIADGGGPGDDAPTVDETSFYACGCQTDDPSSGFVIALAVCALLARRRRT